MYLSGRLKSILSNLHTLKDFISKRDPELFNFLKYGKEKVFQELRKASLEEYVNNAQWAVHQVEESMKNLGPVKGSMITAPGYKISNLKSTPDRTYPIQLRSPGLAAILPRDMSIQEYKKYLQREIRRGNKAVIDALRDDNVLRLLDQHLTEQFHDKNYEAMQWKANRPKEQRPSSTEAGAYGASDWNTGNTHHFREAIKEARNQVSYDILSRNAKKPTFIASTNFPEESFKREIYTPYFSPVHYEIITARKVSDTKIETTYKDVNGRIRTEVVSIHDAKIRNIKGGVASIPVKQNLPYLLHQIPFGPYQGKTLMEIPPSYLASLERQSNELFIKYPVFFMAFEQAMNMPSFINYREASSIYNDKQGVRRLQKETPAISDYFGEAMGGVSNADRNRQQSDYHFFNRRLERYFKNGYIPLQKKERPDIWMDPLIQDEPRMDYENVELYTERQRIDLNPRKTRQRNPRKSDTFDPDRYKSQVMKDFWESIGGIPGRDKYDQPSLSGGFRELVKLKNPRTGKEELEFNFGGMRGMLMRQLNEMYLAKLSYLERKRYKDWFISKVQEYEPLFEQLYKEHETLERMSRGVGFRYDPSRQEGEGFIGMKYSSRDPLKAQLEEDMEERDTYFNYPGKEFSRTASDTPRESWGVTGEPHEKGLGLIEELDGAKSMEELQNIYNEATAKGGDFMHLYNEQINKVYKYKESIFNGGGSSQ